MSSLLEISRVLSSHLFFHLSVISKTCIHYYSNGPVINKKKESSKESKGVGVVYI